MRFVPALPRNLKGRLFHQASRVIRRGHLRSALVWKRLNIHQQWVGKTCGGRFLPASSELDSVRGPMSSQICEEVARDEKQPKPDASIMVFNKPKAYHRTRPKR